LLCEAGFLFRMLEDAKGSNCQASNFSRAFSATPQGKRIQSMELIIATALGLLDDGEKSTSPHGSLIQNFNRWLLSTFSAEVVVDGETFNLRPTGLDALNLGSTASAIDQIVGISTITTNTCQSCGFVTSRDATIHAVDLAYPKKVCHRFDFADDSLLMFHPLPSYFAPPSSANHPPERHAVTVGNSPHWTASDSSLQVQA